MQTTVGIALIVIVVTLCGGFAAALRHRRGTAIVLFLVSALAVAAFARIATRELRKKPEPDRETACVAAIEFARRYVDENFKAPLTAQFPSSCSHIYGGINYDSTFTIRSYVDAQNSYGALIRTGYWAYVTYIGPDANEITSWRLDSLRFDEY